MKHANYEILPNNPVVIKTTDRGKKVRLPHALHVDGKWLSDHSTISSATRQIAAHKRKRAEEHLEDLQLANLLTEF